ncbi:MAG: hypothetical protein ACP5SK_00750 [Thermoprotei archaeon]
MRLPRTLPWRGAYVQAVYAAGALTATLVARAVGAMMFGPLADKRGRKDP